jgi:hypothetical protein
MNQVATQQQNQQPALVGGGGVNAIVPQTADEAYRLATLIHNSKMAPYGLDTPEKVTIAILQGIELGLPPMMALQSIAVINNRPCLWGDGLMGVVRQSPACEHISEWIEGEGDQMIAYCETQRKGEPKPIKRTFSVDDAMRAGLWQTQARVQKKNRKSGATYETDNDSPWWRYPKRMLQMRARALCLRDVYADILKGMQVREEVEDYAHQGPENAKDVTPSLAERMAAKRAEIDTQAEEPAQQEGFDLSHVEETTAQAISQESEEVQEDEAPTIDGKAIQAQPLQQASENPAPVEEPDTDPLRAYAVALRACSKPEEVDALTPEYAEVINSLGADEKRRAKQLRIDRRAELEGNGQ